MSLLSVNDFALVLGGVHSLFSGPQAGNLQPQGVFWCAPESLDVEEEDKRLQPAVRYMMRDLCKAAGVRHFGFHALRHYVARMLVEGGNANLGDIQVLYGHQNATTTDIYLKSLAASPVSHVAPYIEDDVLKKTLAAATKNT